MAGADAHLGLSTKHFFKDRRKSFLSPYLYKLKEMTALFFWGGSLATEVEKGVSIAKVFGEIYQEAM